MGLASPFRLGRTSSPDPRPKKALAALPPSTQDQPTAGLEHPSPPDVACLPTHVCTPHPIIAKARYPNAGRKRPTSPEQHWSTAAKSKKPPPKPIVAPAASRVVQTA